MSGPRGADSLAAPGCCPQALVAFSCSSSHVSLRWSSDQSLGCSHESPRAQIPEGRTFFEPEGSLMRVTPLSGLCATTMQ